MVEGLVCMGMVQQFLANGVQLHLVRVENTVMDTIQYIYTLMSTCWKVGTFLPFSQCCTYTTRMNVYSQVCPT